MINFEKNQTLIAAGLEGYRGVKLRRELMYHLHGQRVLDFLEEVKPNGNDTERKQHRALLNELCWLCLHDLGGIDSTW
ncbi:MAG: hypothetical protein AB1591_10060 [Pseudomonadota bacterium]